MPDIGVFHPQIVHFVVALLFVGVGFRLLAFVRQATFAGPAATMLIVAGTVASVLAVRSGTDTHGPAERIPGARPAVEEHEELGERTRNLFLVVAALELAALALRRKAAYRTGVLAASAAVGLGGLFFLYETAEHGGKLVYAYAGGVGTRSGDDADVERLLLAGLYHQSARDRATGHGERAAELIELMGRRYRDDPGIAFMAIESVFRDRGDAAATRAGLAAYAVPGDDRRLQLQYGLLLADVYEALGYPDSARAVLGPLRQASPDDPRLIERLERLDGGG
ncbi:MAG TPA: DUF2231 domain-containing protein [Gemmatimonadales bacterium]